MNLSYHRKTSNHLGIELMNWTLPEAIIRILLKRDHRLVLLVIEIQGLPIIGLAIDVSKLFQQVHAHNIVAIVRVV